MREVTRTALVPYAAEQMFALVEDVERYSEFLPWVAAVQLIERGPREVVGRMELQRSGLRESITTRNVLNPPREITLALVAGPFKTFAGRWTFDAIGGERGTRVGLSIRFEFANPMLSVLLSRTFEKSCSEMVDAFVARARAIYGAR
jgi:ribosome-associated toxin RatA of RatAB toxin-antitoxin module